VEAELLACVGRADEAFVLLRAIVKMIRFKQNEVIRSDVSRNTAEPAMHWYTWCIMSCGGVYIALVAIPKKFKTDADGAVAGWYVASHSVSLALLVALMMIFWRRVLVRERLVYTLKSLPPWIMLGYALLMWGVNLNYSQPGFEMSDKVSASSFLCACILVLTLDACDCTRRFHLYAFTYVFCGVVFATGMASFVWPDVVVHSGTVVGTSVSGRFTKNGLVKMSYYGIMSLMAPAMVAAWLDKHHASCYLLTDFRYKADLAAVD
jgi:hypothetical protein